MPTEAKLAVQTDGTESGGKKKRKRRGIVTLFPNWCKDCALCVEFCPQGVLELTEDGDVVITNPEKCNACRWCEVHCPDFAIFVQEVPEEEA